jgi:MFS transporter, DHA2 family, multidrug resistance protein
MTVWSMVSVVGFVGGPLLGGAILAHFSWQAVFLINVPIALVALVLTWRSVPESADPSGEPADLVGTVLSVATLGALVYTLVSGPDAGWTSARVIASGLVFLAVASAFCAWEVRTPHPLLPLGFLRKASFAGPALAESTLMFAIAGLMFVVTQQLQLVDGDSPLQAGLRIAPAALGTLLTGAPGVWLARRAGQQWCAALGFAVGAVGLAWLSQTIGGSYWSFAVGLVIFGAGLRMAMTPVALAVIDALPKERAGMGSALNDTFQEVGGALGVAILGCVLNAVYRSHLPAAIAQAAHGSLTGALLSPDPSAVTAARHAFRSGSQAAYVVGAVLMALAAVVALCTVPAALVDPEAAVEQGA